MGNYGIVIYSIKGGIKIMSDKTSQINIYGIDGRLIRTVEVSQGENTIKDLIKGIYLVNNQKVVVK